MKISEVRFKSILAGTATNLTSKEILIRQEAFDAERRGQDPMLAVEAQMPDVTIVRKESYTGTIPPLDVLLENGRQKMAIASGSAPPPVPSGIPKEAAAKGISDDCGTAKSQGWTFQDWLTLWAVVISVLALLAPVVAVPLLGVAAFAGGCFVLIGLGIGIIQFFGWIPKAYGKQSVLWFCGRCAHSAD